MIIHRVWSENVLKYATLELPDLPAPGLIGISGQNEAGKSTIGEIICFALFGRTFSYAEHEIVHVIRWGEPRCAVSVDFSINSQRYAVSRFLDENGNHGVRLSDHHDKPLARGVEPVREALEALVGFGFDEFIESFYLAQREITTPHPHSTAVKKIAGIAALEQVAAHAEVEIQQEHGAIGDTERAVAEIEQLIAALNLDASVLPTLERQREALRLLQEQGAQHTAALQATTERYQDTRNKMTTALQAFGNAGIDTTYQGWRERVESLIARVEELVRPHHNDPTLTGMLSALKDFASDAQQRLAGIDRLRDTASMYRQHLARLLGEGAETPAHDQPTIEPLGNTRARLQNRLSTATGRRTRLRVGLYVLLSLALVVWALWGVLTQAPESRIAQDVSAWLAGTLGAWELRHTAWLLPVAGILSALVALCGWGSLQLGATVAQRQRALDEVDGQIMQARQQAAALDAGEHQPLPQAVSIYAGLPARELASEVLRFKQSASADWVEPARLDGYRVQLGLLKERVASNLSDWCRTLAAQSKTVQDEMATRQGHINQLDQEIAAEQARQQRLREFQAALASHQESIAARHQRIRVRELAGDLLKGGAQYIAKTFNRDIRSLVSRTLPLLTQGRYEHLKIDENLDVQVFSNDKRDFMQLEEISSGTQRQIMLAVRLALSQQFINTTLGCRQFIFLDEPFAFFDEERTRSALRALPQLSDELSQIWIVAQSFPRDFAFDLHIQCSPDKDVLILPRE